MNSDSAPPGAVPGREISQSCEVDVRFFCKGCVPEEPFWSEHELVKHILEVRGIPHRTAPYTEGKEE